jgi:hypothetical protein
LVRFPPMSQNSSFGFVDPRDVLRGGMSRCAKDGKDYN